MSPSALEACCVSNYDRSSRKRNCRPGHSCHEPAFTVPLGLPATTIRWTLLRISRFLGRYAKIPQKTAGGPGAAATQKRCSYLRRYLGRQSLARCDGDEFLFRRGHQSAASVDRKVRPGGMNGPPDPRRRCQRRAAFSKECAGSPKLLRCTRDIPAAAVDVDGASRHLIDALGVRLSRNRLARALLETESISDLIGNRQT